jgi:hypothetical protein
MSKPKKLTRREFAGAALAAAAAPTLLRGALVQEEKRPEEPKAQAPQQEEENWLKRGRQALQKFNLPADTEPAFVFQARGRANRP